MTNTIKTSKRCLRSPQDRIASLPFVVISLLAWLNAVYCQEVPSDSGVVTEGELRSFEGRINDHLEQLLASLQLQAAKQMTPQQISSLTKAVPEAKQVVEQVATQLDPQTKQIVSDITSVGEKISKITQDAPQKDVSDLLSQAQSKAQELRDRALSTANRYYAEAKKVQNQLLFDGFVFEKAAEPVRDKVLQALNKLGITVPQNATIDDIGNAARSLTREGCWTPEMLASLPSEVIPNALKSLVMPAKAKQSVEDAAGPIYTFMNTVMTLAIATGNPYVIAGAVILSILAAIFGGQFGSGGGNGKGPGKGNSEGDNHAPGDLGGNGNHPGGNPSGNTSETPQNTQIKLGNSDISVTGNWPQLTFSKAGAVILKLDLTNYGPKSPQGLGSTGDESKDNFWVQPPYNLQVTKGEKNNYFLVYHRTNLTTTGTHTIVNYIVTADPADNGNGFHKVNVALSPEQ